MLKRLKYAGSSILLGFIIVGCASTKTGFESSPAFKEIATNRIPIWDESVHPFSGAAVIDIDDGKMEVFVSGGNNQLDALLSYQAGELIDIIEGTGLSSFDRTDSNINLPRKVSTSALMQRQGSA